jgi:prepilin-type N-terminal cleavage/methylation domain-containing protein
MRRKNGFTLIELLVVVSIISLLVSISMPAMSAVRRKGYATTCQTRLYEISRALWAYSVANDSRVPYVESPMVNPVFGNAAVSNDDANPFDREKWPLSLQNVLMPMYLGEEEAIFSCPAATRGWPRGGGLFRVAYRDAGANQPNGVVDSAGTYFRESFGFLDGRPMEELRVHFTGNPIMDLQRRAWARGTYVRDLVEREGSKVRGPHDGGINVLNREFGVEFRDVKTIQQDLAPAGGGVQF